jgi:hypothetical protein
MGELSKEIGIPTLPALYQMLPQGGLHGRGVLGLPVLNCALCH